MRRRNVFAMGLALAIGGAGAAFLVDDSVAAPPPLLQLLSPPGAGYDSTNGVLYTGSGGAVTFTRASTATCTDPSGTIRDLASGKPCVSGGALRARSAVSNLLSNPEALDNAAWGDIGTPTVTADAYDFGRGLTGELIEDNGGAANEGRFQAYTTSTNGAYTFSCHLAAGTSAEARILVNGNGTTVTGNTTCTFTDLTADAKGADARRTCTATLSGSPLTNVAPQVVVGDAASDTGTIKVGGCQLVTGSQPGDYCPGGTCAAETATTTFDAAPAASPWCVRARLGRSSNDSAWNDGAGGGVWSNNVTGNGRINIYVSVAGQLKVEIEDADGALKEWATPASLATQTSVLARVCYDGAAPLIWLDGAAQTLGSSGAGTGVLPALATLSHWGSLSTSLQLRRNLQEICFDDSLTGCQ